MLDKVPPTSFPMVDRVSAQVSKTAALQTPGSARGTCDAALSCQEVTTMKPLRSLLGTGLAVVFMLLAVVEVAWPQPKSPMPPGEGAGGYGLIAFVCVMALLIAVGIAVKVFDVKRKRDDEGIALQSRLSDALLSDPALAGVPITPTVHVPFSRRGQVVITLTGAVPSPARRETVMELVNRVATPLEAKYQIEDRLIVDPRMVRRAA
jgi:hypothetical protein